MTVDIDLWVTATILRELRDNGLITQKEAEKILSRVAKQTGATLIISVWPITNQGILHSAGTHKDPDAEYRHRLSKVSLRFC